MIVQLEVPPIKKNKVEILDFKDQNSQIKFNEITSESEVFTDCLENMLPVSQQANNWLKTLKAHCQKAFKTIRIRSKGIIPSKADRIIGQQIKDFYNLQGSRK